MSEEFFPIQTPTACKSKWAWSTIWFYDGTTASCHRCDRHKIDLDDFDNFHNTPQKIEQREAMLKGQWPTKGGCEYCQKTEEAGGFSDRQFQLQIPNQTPPEVKTDQSVTSCTPTILEIFLSNTCNLSCIYCRPANSSKIEGEMRKYGNFKVEGIHTRGKYDIVPKVDYEQELKEKFWDWMARNSGALKRFHVLGGEPFYMKDFEKCLTHWADYPNPNVELNVVSNLMVGHDSFEFQIDFIKWLHGKGCIRRFDLTASIDCWGPEAEYVRTGLDLGHFEKNMEYLLAQDEHWLRININQTVSALTIKSMPALIEKINTWKDRRTEVGHYFQRLVEPAVMQPTIFHKGFWNEDFAKITAVMRNKTWDEKHAYNMMQGMIKQIESETQHDSESINKLRMYLDELDSRRGTDWRKIFTWLK